MASERPEWDWYVVRGAWGKALPSSMHAWCDTTDPDLSYSMFTISYAVSLYHSFYWHQVYTLLINIIQLHFIRFAFLLQQHIVFVSSFVLAVWSCLFVLLWSGEARTTINTHHRLFSDGILLRLLLFRWQCCEYVYICVDQLHLEFMTLGSQFWKCTYCYNCTQRLNKLRISQY